MNRYRVEFYPNPRTSFRSYIYLYGENEWAIEQVMHDYRIVAIYEQNEIDPSQWH